jgi:hypothetical protein
LKDIGSMSSGYVSDSAVANGALERTRFFYFWAFCLSAGAKKSGWQSALISFVTFLHLRKKSKFQERKQSF